uniref:Uncharacterized protein n=1 Tax=Echinococcus granulosus TaxID=6210 RepID=A0A068WRG1_ECHGR|nr:hypothetical protein EgrG_000356750 [Echinococcus granulosus]
MEAVDPANAYATPSWKSPNHVTSRLHLDFVSLIHDDSYLINCSPCLIRVDAFSVAVDSKYEPSYSHHDVAYAEPILKAIPITKDVDHEHRTLLKSQRAPLTFDADILLRTFSPAFEPQSIRPVKKFVKVHVQSGTTEAAKGEKRNGGSSCRYSANVSTGCCEENLCEGKDKGQAMVW